VTFTWPPDGAQEGDILGQNPGLDQQLILERHDLHDVGSRRITPPMVVTLIFFTVPFTGALTNVRRIVSSRPMAFSRDWPSSLSAAPVPDWLRNELFLRSVICKRCRWPGAWLDQFEVGDQALGNQRVVHFDFVSTSARLRSSPEILCSNARRRELNDSRSFHDVG